MYRLQGYQQRRAMRQLRRHRPVSAMSGQWQTHAGAREIAAIRAGPGRREGRRSTMENTLLRVPETLPPPGPSLPSMAMEHLLFHVGPEFVESVSRHLHQNA